MKNYLMGHEDSIHTVHIEVPPDAQLKHQRPYAVPQIHWETSKKNLQHLVKNGV